MIDNTHLDIWREEVLAGLLVSAEPDVHQEHLLEYRLVGVPQSSSWSEPTLRIIVNDYLQN